VVLALFLGQPVLDNYKSALAHSSHHGLAEMDFQILTFLRRTFFRGVFRAKINLRVFNRLVWLIVSDNGTARKP
jgi:hypothetical protein